jgi:hypothetical protein
MDEKLLVIAWAAGELACRPGSVHPLARAGDHPSRTAVADSLLRSTREHRAGSPQSLAQDSRQRRGPLLTLLRVGFTKPPGSPQALVVSYTTVSPLPPDESGGGLFSVALSRGSPRVGVTDHPALRSPDLPRRARLLARRGRPADSPAADFKPMVRALQRPMRGPLGPKPDASPCDGPTARRIPPAGATAAVLAALRATPPCSWAGQPASGPSGTTSG